MFRCEVSFKSGDEVGFQEKLGRIPGTPARFEVRSFLQWDNAKRLVAEARVTIVADLDNDEQLAAIEALIEAGQSEASVTTYPVESRVVKPTGQTARAAQQSQPKAERALTGRQRREAEGRTMIDIKRPWVDSGLTEAEWMDKMAADREALAERSAMRAAAEAEKKQLLRDLDAKHKAEVEARRAIRAEAEAREVQVEVVLDEKFDASQEALKTRLASGGVPGARGKTSKSKKGGE